jgi:RNA polymerase sigma-70 factor (ECF subfamily)
MDGVRILEWLAPAVPAEAVDWDSVYREEMPRVFNYLRYRGFDRPTAEDLTSATFEKAWRARDRYRRDRAGVPTWLLAIARNAATDHLRRTRPAVPLAEASLRDEETPETQALREAQSRRLRALLAELPERERELLALKYGAEATNRAIATITGLGESNVGTILHRTIGALRDRWTKEEPRE